MTKLTNYQQNVSDIVVVSGHTRSNFQENYCEALRYAVGLVRDGIEDLEVQQVGLLHDYDEIYIASEALEENFTDEELIEEVHHASRGK